MNSEHVEVLCQMWQQCANDRRMIEADALDAAIAALSAPKPPADTTVCTGDEIRCHDGHGCECAMRGQPPAEAQPVGEVLQRHVVTKYRDGSVHVDDLAAPPSAPVGVEDIIEAFDEITGLFNGLRAFPA